MTKTNKSKTGGVPSFLTKFNKSVSTLDEVSSSATEPVNFFDSGSCIVNKIISDRYDGGYPWGRMALLAGPANSGKSFLLGNAVKNALDAGYGALVIDSENALDKIYLGKIGVDVDSPYLDYKGLNSISNATKVIATFLREYTAVPEDERIPFLIAIDSIDELKTDTQTEKASKGETNSDMGQQAKQLKQFQSTIMHAIKHLPIAVVCTKQPYANQDAIASKREPHVITPSLRFAYSQILVITNRLLKDNTTNKFEGINLDVYGHKTRFAKPFQKCTIEVPYESGMDWYSGVLEAAESTGLVERNGAWYTFGDQKFQKKNFESFKEQVFEELKKNNSTTILDYDPDKKIEEEAA